jgi:DNA-binding response OmpR family regulator
VASITGRGFTLAGEFVAYAGERLSRAALLNVGWGVGDLGATGLALGSVKIGRCRTTDRR